MIIAVGDRFASWPASNSPVSLQLSSDFIVQQLYNVTIQRLYKTFTHFNDIGVQNN